jgi:cell division protein FtsB
VAARGAAWRGVARRGAAADGAGGQAKKWDEPRVTWHDRGSVSRPEDLLERALPIGILCLALIAVPLLVLEPEGLPRLRGLEKELDEVNAENADSYREVQRLRVEVRELKDDPAAIERIARGELGMVRKSEVVFQFGR